MTKLNVQKLEDIGKLPDNWNGYGARKFTPSLINKCQEIAKSLPVETTIYPTGRQSIQFQYDKNGDYLELEVYEDHTFCLCMLKRDYGQVKTIRLTNDKAEEIRKYIQKQLREEESK